MRVRPVKQEPYGYRPSYLQVMDKASDPNCVNTPALQTGVASSFGPPPEDKELNRRVEQFRTGKITCREAIVAMFWIRPHTDYRPHITAKFRHYVEMMDRFGDNFRKGPIPIVLYEHKGQLIMSADYKTYWLHRMDESWTVRALILGDFTERDFCRGLGEPFAVNDLDLTPKDALMNSNTRRLALLMRGEQIRIETDEEREAINKQDFELALKEPVPYEPEWASSLNQHGEDPNLVLTPAVHTGHFFGPMPEDEQYTELATKAQSGELECQLATVALAMMRPYSDYLPNISAELREEFDTRHETPDELSLTVYEYEPGHFMVGSNENNLAVYRLLREEQPLYAHCVILGQYTKTWAVGAIGKPFRVTLSPQSGYDPDKTTHHIGKRLYEIMLEKNLDLVQLSLHTGIEYQQLRKIVNKHAVKAPSIECLERIARVLGVPTSDFMPF